jgi:hypothetical protein
MTTAKGRAARALIRMCLNETFAQMRKPRRHGRTWCGHPRLSPPFRKAWVAGPSPAMTKQKCSRDFCKGISVTHTYLPNFEGM